MPAKALSEEERQRLVKQREEAIHQAMALDKQGKRAEAIAAVERSLELEERLLGTRFSPTAANSYDWIADRRERRDEWPAAIAAREQSYLIRKQVLGAEHFATINSRVSLAHAKQVQALSADQRAELRQAVIKNDEVLKLFAAKQFKEALPLAQQVLDSRRKLLREALPSDYSNLAQIHVQLGQAATAEPLLEKAFALERRQRGGNHPYVAEIAMDLAALSTRQGKLTKSRPLYEEAWNIRAKSLGEEHRDTLTSLYELAKIEHDLGHFLLAETHYRLALMSRERILGPEDPVTVATLGALANVVGDLGDYRTAESLQRRVLSLHQKTFGEEHATTAVSCHNLGHIYRMQGDLARAKALFEKAIEINRAAPNTLRENTGHFLHSLARLHKNMGDLDTARELHEEALKILTETLGRKHPHRAACLHNLGVLERERGDDATARAHMLQALEIYRAAAGQTRNVDIAVLLRSLALVEHRQKNVTKAIEFLRQAQEIERSTLGEQHPQTSFTTAALATALLGQRGNAEAAKLYRASLEIRQHALGADHPHVADGLSQLATVAIAAADWKDAQQLVSQSQRIMANHWMRTFAIQSERQQMALVAGDETLDLVLSLAIGPSAPSSAGESYAALLQRKGVVFAQQARLRQLRGDPQLAGRFDAYLGVCTRLATRSLAEPEEAQRDAWRKDLRDLRQQKERLEAEFAERSAAFRQQATAKPLAAADLQKLLPQASALIDFVEFVHFSPPPEKKGPPLRERRFAAFVVKPQGEVHGVDLGPADRIAKTIEAWRKQMQAKRCEDRDTAAALRELLWDKIEPLVRDARTVLISPDGALNGFNWSALPGKEPGTYLLEEKAVAVVPAPQLLPLALNDSQAAKTRAKESLLLLGDIDYQAPAGGGATDEVASRAAAERGGNQRDFTPLTNTREELLAVADSFSERFGEAGVRKLRRGAATEAAFREQAPRSRFLHVATHGFFASPDIKSALARTLGDAEALSRTGNEGIAGWHPGLLSGLALAGANLPPKLGGDDGVLTATEVGGLDLREVELAVLSACETGLGQVAGGEGILGLQRSFQMAGARTTVTSLWRVDDRATKELMIRFYENLWTKKLSKVEALRQAQLWMLREGGKDRGLVPLDEEQRKTGRAPPYYWAAFVLAGDWR